MGPCIQTGHWQFLNTTLNVKLHQLLFNWKKNRKIGRRSRFSTYTDTQKEKIIREPFIPSWLKRTLKICFWKEIHFFFLYPLPCFFIEMCVSELVLAFGHTEYLFMFKKKKKKSPPLWPLLPYCIFLLSFQQKKNRLLCVLNKKKDNEVKKKNVWIQRERLDTVLKNRSSI